VAVETTRVIRPAAVLTEQAAHRVLTALEELDVARGGMWNVTPGLWQRFDKAWEGGAMGGARLLGTIGAVYGTPSRYEITIYRATVTAYGAESGWTVEALCDDALVHAGLTLDTCPRASLVAPPLPSPFRQGDVDRRPGYSSSSQTDTTMPNPATASRSTVAGSLRASAPPAWPPA
jgi:hypothetical protein